MRIAAVTTCVSRAYAERLALGIETWRDTLDEWIVVTTATDRATLDLCQRHRVRTLATNAFTRDPRAIFDKAQAINEGLAALAPSDWLLLIDADVRPPVDWRRALECCEPGTLYGARRGQHARPVVSGTAPVPGPPVRPGMRNELGGFFHLWAAADPAWTAEPTLGSYVSAGAYDSAFEMRWPRERRLRLQLTLSHSGRPDRDWCGVGNDAGFREMLKKRRELGGWGHERLD